MTRRKRLLLILGVLLAAYVGSYLAVSRRGYAEADRWHVHGFYYVTPQDTNAWQYKNHAYVIFFAPANWVDRLLGTGRRPACPPLFGLSK